MADADDVTKAWEAHQLSRDNNVTAWDLRYKHSTEGVDYVQNLEKSLY